MARIRTIKPDFFLDEEVAALDPLTRILFAGLWCLADKAGRMEDRPQRIKIQILPYDNCDVDASLQDLADARFIIRYEVNGQRLIQIRSFDKHQKCHSTEKDSELPSYNGEITVKEPLSDRYETTGKERKGKERNIVGRGCGGNQTSQSLPVDNPNQENLPPLPDDDGDIPLEKTFSEKSEPQKPTPPQSATPGPKPPEPSPSRNTHGERWTKQQGMRFEELMGYISHTWGAQYHQLTYVQVQADYNRGNPEAVLYCLGRLIADLKAGKKIPTPGRWLKALMWGNGDGHPGENGRFEAEETAKEGEEHRRDDGASIGGTLRQMARASP